MASRLFKVLVANAVILVAEYLVIRDIQGRTAYAARQGLSPSYSYSILTQFFTLVRGSTTLQSPPTFDWVQGLVAVLVLVNLWYAYGALRRGRTSSIQQRPLS
ncbi:MAG: hypothetical protein HY297_01240 [Thaumarchaeota archaeon]|nr:hypothetical protein [Nitrososphaerota archaeon]